MPSEWKKKILQNFDDQARLYQENSSLQGDVANNLNALLPTMKKARILEIGCGSGRLTQFLLAKYPCSQLHITDISPNMINMAKQHAGPGNNIQWSVMDGEDIQCDDAYDLIVSNMAFQWFERPEHSLRQLIRQLTPTGRILYTVPSSQSFKEWRASLLKLGLNHGFQRDNEWPGIIKEENIKVRYDSTLNFLRSLREIGANTPDDNYEKLNVADIKKACRETDISYNGNITWHMLYGEITNSK